MAQVQGAPEAPPEAQLILLARQARGMSPEDAAPLTGGMIKASRWRQIEKGYATRSGERVPTSATDPVLARMAHVVGVTSQQLTEAGRSGAALILDEILRQERPLSDSARASDSLTVDKRFADPTLQAIWELPGLDEDEREMAIAAVEQVRFRREMRKREQSSETRRHA